MCQPCRVSRSSWRPASQSCLPSATASSANSLSTRCAVYPVRLPPTVAWARGTGAVADPPRPRRAFAVTPTSLRSAHAELCNLEQENTENVTLKWQNGGMSNFDYLMYLNSLADRTFNDLTQCARRRRRCMAAGADHAGEADVRGLVTSARGAAPTRYPVFPWVLADYTSATLGRPRGGRLCAGEYPCRKRG